MTIENTALALRGKIIGTLIREARVSAQQPIEQCAKIIGVPVEDWEAYELGDMAISLPELEAFAYFSQIPTDHFWEKDAITADSIGNRSDNLVPLIHLRHRIIGAMLRQARLEAQISLHNLAEQLGVSDTLLDAYELGTQPVPLPTLEYLCGILNRSIREFQDQKGPIGIWNEQQRAMHDFLALPPNIQTFITKPVNRPYLDLAIRLSEMTVEKLRAVAEGLLEITY